MATPDLVCVETREILCCEWCTLVQFRTGNGLCRRCHKPFEAEDSRTTTFTIIPPRPVVEKKIIKERRKEPFVDRLAELLLYRRNECNMSVLTLVNTAHVSLASIKKIEDGDENPGLLILERLAWGLYTKGSSLLKRVEDPEAPFEERIDGMNDGIFQGNRILHHVGPTIKRNREAVHFSQKDLLLAVVKKRNASLKTIEGWESGYIMPHFSTIKKIAAVFGLPLSVLVAEMENAAFP